MIPVSVIVMTKNEEENLPLTLPPLIENFAEVFVVDSHSTDRTRAIAEQLGAKVRPFTWNGQYPKKKQWSIENLPLRHDWVFLCDADEIVTDQFIAELNTLKWDRDGYFVSTRLIWNGKNLRFGARNNKLCLFHKDRFIHPVINDLDITGGWEVEGHYQPVATISPVTIGQIKSPIHHRDETESWLNRHARYCDWEVAMIQRDAFPPDPIARRQRLKTLTRASCLRPYIHFIYGYFYKCGFLDGRAGLDYALKRFGYNRRIVRAIRHSNAAP